MGNDCCGYMYGYRYFEAREAKMRTKRLRLLTLGIIAVLVITALVVGCGPNLERNYQSGANQPIFWFGTACMTVFTLIGLRLIFKGLF